MKVYLVLKGDMIHGNKIEGIFTNKKQAYIYAGLYECWVDVYDADELGEKYDKIVDEQPRILWRALVSKNNRIEMLYESHYTYKKVLNVQEDLFHLWDIDFTTPYNTKKDQAEKILLDKLAQYKAQQEK